MMFCGLFASVPLLCGTLAEGNPPLAMTLVAEASPSQQELLPAVADGEQALLIIKPEAVAHKQVGAILEQVEQSHLSIIGLRMRRLSLDEAKQFYSVHAERPFFTDLAGYMSSGPVVTVALQGKDAVGVLRRLIGATNPREAAAGTLRQRFGTSVQENGVHGSDSPEHGREEVSFFFSPAELYSIKNPSLNG